MSSYPGSARQSINKLMFEDFSEISSVMCCVRHKAMRMPLDADRIVKYARESRCRRRIVCLKSSPFCSGEHPTVDGGLSYGTKNIGDKSWLFEDSGRGKSASTSHIRTYTITINRKPKKPALDIFASLFYKYSRRFEGDDSPNEIYRTDSGYGRSAGAAAS
jgi:hypothetical protein